MQNESAESSFSKTKHSMLTQSKILHVENFMIIKTFSIRSGVELVSYCDSHVAMLQTMLYAMLFAIILRCVSYFMYALPP